MSWGTRTLVEASKDAIEVPDPVLSDDVGSEQAEQLTAAREALAALVGAVGRPGDKVVVTLSGHANPGHAPRPGWANECITVQVTAVPQD